MPVLAAQVVVRVHPQQIRNVRVKAVVCIQVAAVDVLFRHVGEVVAHLRQPVGNVLRNSVLIRLEDQPHRGALQQIRIEPSARRGDRDQQALVIRQYAVPRIQPQRVRFPRLHGEGEVQHVAHRPQRIAHFDVHCHVFAMGRRYVQRGQIDGNAIQARIQVVPGIRRHMGRIRRQSAKIGRDKNVHNRHACGGIRIGRGPRQRASAAAGAIPHGCPRRARYHGAFPRWIPIVNEVDQRYQAWIGIERPVGGQPVPQLNHPLRRIPGVNVIRGKLANRSLLLHIREPQLPACHRRGVIVEGRLLPARPLEQCLRRQHGPVQPRPAHLVLGDVRRQQVHLSERAAAEFQVVPRLVRHDERNRLA